MKHSRARYPEAIESSCAPAEFRSQYPKTFQAREVRTATAIAIPEATGLCRRASFRIDRPSSGLARELAAYFSWDRKQTERPIWTCPLCPTPSLTTFRLL